MPSHASYCREGAKEIKRLTIEAKLWEERTKQGSEIIVGNVIEISRLRDKIEQKSTDISVLGKRIEERDEIIETLRALLQEWIKIYQGRSIASSLLERSRAATEK
jgi:hypothetical protein